MVPQYLIDYILKTKNVARHHEKVTSGAVYVLASVEQNAFYVQQAIKNGARYAIVSRYLHQRVEYENTDCEIILVDDPAKFWAYAASLIYKTLPQIVTTVTGTSGKTSVAHMYAQAAAILRQKALYIGTLGATKIGQKEEKIADTLTTPDILELRKILSESGCEYACIESSSHGIDQRRIDYIPFTVAAFTNLAPEHLDYHGDIETYFNAKKRLFTDYNTDNLTLNSDDHYSQKLIEICQDKNVITYGKNGNLQLINYNPGHNFELKFNDKIYKIDCKILGIFNIYNILCVIGMLTQSGFYIDEVVSIVHKLKLPNGRMEKIVKNNLEVFIDYAHKPNALEAVLQSLVEYRDANNKEQLWIVFGCGGDRDKEKRSIMGEIAGRLADKVVITDDNPRHEDPKNIRNSIIDGIKGDYIEIADRQLAIEYAIQSAGENDIVLVAGKGHEKYQIIGSEKIEFSDIDVINKTQL